MILPIKNINQIVKDITNTENKNTKSFSLSDSYPKDDANNVNKTTNIVLHFPEPVDYGEGHFLIYNAEDDSLVEKIKITSNRVHGKGSSKTSPDVFYDHRSGKSDLSINWSDVITGGSQYNEFSNGVARDWGLSVNEFDRKGWSNYIIDNYDIILNGGTHKFNGDKISVIGQYERSKAVIDYFYFFVDGEPNPITEKGYFNGGVAKGSLTFVPKAGSTEYSIDLTKDLDDDANYYIHI